MSTETFKQPTPRTRIDIRAGIFVASYAKDFPYLRGLLLSIKKFCKGFHRVSVAVPLRDKPLLLRYFKEWGLENGHNRMNLLIWGQDEEIEDGFMKAQFAMMSMNHFLWDCDVYCLVGSDCIFTDAVTPQHYMPNGKPMMRIDSRKFLGDANPTWNWAAGTEKATGYRPSYDYMRQLPLFYTPRMLEVTKQRVREHTGDYLRHYINAGHKDFSESNVMGCCSHILCPEECEWVKDKPLPMPMNLIQFWSHGDFDTHKLEKNVLYNDWRARTQSTKGKTAAEVTLDILRED